MIDAEKLSVQAATLYRELDGYDVWDKRSVVAILNTILQLEMDNNQRETAANQKKA